MAVTGHTVQIHLSVEIDSDPIAGACSVDAGAPRRFTGWIELVAAIEAARHGGTVGGEETLGLIPGGKRGGV